MTDQADRLRRLMDGGAPGDSALSFGPPDESTDAVHDQDAPPTSAVEANDTPPRNAMAQQARSFSHAIAVCSGKGGVGKSNLAVNLATTYAMAGRTTVLVDADLGTSNADVLCNLTPRYTIDHVLRGQCSLNEIVLDGPGGLQLIPGVSGIDRLAELSLSAQRQILEQFVSLEHKADSLIIDAAAGIGSNVKAFASAAKVVVVITTPEPTALTDAYAMIKSLVRNTWGRDIRVVVNEADEAEAADVFVRLNRVSQRFLDQPLKYLGAIPWDGAISQAVRARVPVKLYAPDAPATLAIDRLARKLAGESAAAPVVATHEQSSTQDHSAPSFFARLGQWLRGTAFADA